MLAGSDKTGGVMSATVTVNSATLVLSSRSEAVHTTVVVPKGNVAPDAGLQVTGTAPSTSSFAVAA